MMEPSPIRPAIILLLLSLVACQPQMPPAATPPTATATMPPSATPGPASVPDVISPANAGQLVLKSMNMGTAIGEPAYSPDGKWLYQASSVGTYAYDTASYQEVHLLAASPVATPALDAQMLSRLELLPEYAVQPQSLETIISPDGSLVAQNFRQNFVAVWSLADGKLLYRFEAEGVLKALSPDNRLITLGRTIQRETYDIPCIDLYDLQTGERLGSWVSVRAFFLSDSTLVVDADGYTRIFDARARKVPHAFPGMFPAFSADEQNVAVLYGNEIHIYRVADDKLLQKMDSRLPSTDAAVLRFSPDGQILVSNTIEYYCCAGFGARLTVWQVAGGGLLADLSQYSGSSFVLSPDAQTILVGSQVLRTSDGSLIKDLEADFISAVTNLGFTPDGQQIIVRDASGERHVYPVEDGMLGTPRAADREAYLPILPSASGSIAEDVIDVPSPDGKFIAKRYQGVVTLWELSGAGERFQIPLFRVRCLAFSPNGQILALGLPDGSVELWDVHNKQRVYALPPLTDDDRNSIGGLAFSPDGKLLAIGSEDGIVRVFGLDVK